MSKNTKIIAVVGGVLIVLGLGYLMFTGGSTRDALGCGGKKGKKARVTFTQADMEWQGCRKYNFVPKVTQKSAKAPWTIVMMGKRKAEPKGGKENLKQATCECLNLWKTKCADATKDAGGKTFKDKNGPFCVQKATMLAKAGCGGGGGGDDE